MTGQEISKKEELSGGWNGLASSNKQVKIVSIL